MKVRLFFVCVVSGALVVGCSKTDKAADQNIVQDCYVHKYGVTLSKRDWESRGRDGQVISTRKDGVIVTKNYCEGILEGTMTYTFPHSQTLARVITYKKGIPVREMENFASGMPKREEEDTASGSKIITCWYETGSPLSIEEYHQGRLITGKYYSIRGENRDSEVVNGEGIRKQRDGYGQMVCCDTIENGETVLRTSFHPNGAPKELIPYKNGVISGVKKTFSPGGEPNSIEEWLSGKQHGTTTVFRNGEKYAEILYEHGLKEGVERRYKNGVVLQEEIFWRRDLKHGPTRVFFGDLTKTDWYYQGKLVSKIAFEQLSQS